jgi:hypothetical protein
VQPDFANFLKQSGIQNLTLCGVNGKEQSFEVFVLNDHDQTLQIKQFQDFPKNLLQIRYF